MDDCILTAKLDDRTTLYVSPIDPQTYEEHVSDNNLGGGDGYFVARALDDGQVRRFDILAKACSLEAAGDLFDMIVQSRRWAPSSAR